jgi:S1-C subfamily serine protease
MKLGVLLTVVGLLVFFGVIAPVPVMSQADINQLGLAVVQITAYTGDRAISSGSGTLVSSTGRIFTNWHVVEGADDYEIALLEDINELPVPRYYASLEQSFADIDFAVLQIDRNIRGRVLDPDTLNLPFIPLADGDVVRGDIVTAFGYPDIGDGFLVVTSGSITTIQNGRVDGVSMPVVYQTNAELAPGNSGGAAVNDDGELIGIPFYVASENRTGGRLGGLIPIALAVQLLENDTTEVVRNPANATNNANVTGGVDVDCGGGISIEDGIETNIVQMRSGYTYTVTVVGLNGFAPILAVVSQFGATTCVTTPAAPSTFAFSLPTTGQVTTPTNSVQYSFSQNTGQGLADMRLVVGGQNATFGEFVLILEGMAFTEFDGIGDPIIISLTPRMMNSAVPMSVYMIGIVNALDPLFFIRENNNPIFICDDAGFLSNCPSSESLVGSYVTRSNNTTLNADALDSMLSVPWSTATNLDKSQTLPLSFFMASSSYASYGHYIFALHTSSR